MFEMSFYTLMRMFSQEYGLEGKNVVNDIRGIQLLNKIQDMSEEDFELFRTILKRNVQSIKYLVNYIRENYDLPEMEIFDYNDVYLSYYHGLEEDLKNRKVQEDGIKESSLKCLEDFCEEVTKSLDSGVLKEHSSFTDFVREKTSDEANNAMDLYNLRKNIEDYFYKVAFDYHQEKPKMKLSVKDLKSFVDAFSFNKAEEKDSKHRAISAAWDAYVKIYRTSQCISDFYSKVFPMMTDIVNSRNYLNYLLHENADTPVYAYRELSRLFNNIRSSLSCISCEHAEKIGDFIVYKSDAISLHKAYAYFSLKRVVELGEYIRELLVIYENKSQELRESLEKLILEQYPQFDLNLISVYDRSSEIKCTLENYAICEVLENLETPQENLIKIHDYQKFNPHSSYDELKSIVGKRKCYGPKGSYFALVDRKEDFDAIGEKKLSLYFEAIDKLSETAQISDKEVLNVAYDSVNLKLTKEKEQ